jgi:uncharacterized protein YjbI with pentapeptide repeats
MASEPHAPLLAPERERAADVALASDQFIEHRTFTGDVSASGANNVEISGSLFRAARLTGIDLPGITIRDCRFENCELSGAVLDAARMIRVEFVDCRLSGAVLSDARLDDVRMVDCRCEGLLLRMTALKRSEFRRCDLTNAEFYDARLQHVSLVDGDLSCADFSRAQLDQVRLRGSVLADLRGGASLRGAIIDPGQIVPMGLVALDALGISVDDGGE